MSHSLDRLMVTRFIAAALVVLSHFGRDATGAALVPGVLLSLGPIAVSYFFVVSGFVMVPGDLDRAGRPAFWIARFARIYPLCLVGPVWCVALGGSWSNTGALILHGMLLQAWDPVPPIRTCSMRPAGRCRSRQPSTRRSPGFSRRCADHRLPAQRSA